MSTDDYDDLLADLDEDLDEPDEEETEDEEIEEPEPEPEPMMTRSRSTAKASTMIAEPATATSEAVRRPLISGHCAFPQSKDPNESHRRCRGYSRANPDKIFQPCPCPCHFPEDRYECECGATLAEAVHYPLDEDGDVRYVHVDPTTGRMVDGECPR